VTSQTQSEVLQETIWDLLRPLIFGKNLLNWIAGQMFLRVTSSLSDDAWRVSTLGCKPDMIR